MRGIATMLNQYKEGRAAAQKEMTYKEIQEAIPKLLEIIEQKEIRLVPNAFNSHPEFIACFQASAIAAVPLILLDLTQCIRRIGASLDEIKSELAISNIARVQGWADDGFGTYVHRFVQNEMAPVEGHTRGASHFFYVWNPDGDWYPDFEGRQRQDPLSPNFGGYHHDLATICLRMRADRRALIATTEDNNNAVFHLIIPSYYPIVIDTPIVFAAELFPLTITGSRHRGTDLVWFNLDERSRFPSPQLEFIGVLPLAENNVRAGAAATFQSRFPLAPLLQKPFSSHAGPLRSRRVCSRICSMGKLKFVCGHWRQGPQLALNFRKETHVAPATANSTVLAFVNKDMQQTNAAVEIIIMASLAGWLSIILQITTGANNKKTMSGLRIARATLIVEEREKI
ncbi:hypothetical protein FOXB_12876 [Fusarium oxysporum f. sp. conglutinans Fo5176]|uniref:Uncharacterized protein n=1 Tax=Fusarium oxysporum (strain Fo5176) TaxID=660025 RepID=F9G2L0_FUSOF|nr:hypothetical protein FOXB_12876 [Fusarium oxysporum f. sp. conglutinans Fo5176]